MAKKYNQVKEKKIKDLLTNQQINKVDDVGDYIDTQIESHYPATSIDIDSCVMEFKCEPITHTPLSYPEPQRKLMQSLLFTRFTDAEWRITWGDHDNWTLFMRNF